MDRLDKLSRVRRRQLPTVPVALVLILTGALALRLWGIGSGLPAVYNLDEYAHFVTGAARMSDWSLNPHYFQNPPAFTYLLHLVFSVAYGLPAGESIGAALNGDPTTLYVIARVTTALLGVGAVGALFVSARRMYGEAVGLLSAALLSVTFLPVFYSHFALNDVPTLLPLAVGLIGVAGISTKGRRIDYVLAGVGLGVATATKYTAAALVVAIVLAAALRVREGRGALRRELTNLAFAGGVALAAFVALNPFSVLDHKEFLDGVSRQQDQSANVAKLGTDDTSGWRYYLWTLTWGFGVAPCALAAVGAVVALRRNWQRALPWVAFALAVWLFMGSQQRFYARWFMPVYPVLALFAAYAIVQITNVVRRGRLFVAVALGVIAFVQPLVTVVHSDTIIDRPDTRDLAKAWLLEHVGRGSRVVSELIAPPAYFNEGNQRDGAPLFDLYPQPRGADIERYALTLSPATIDTYVQGHYCYVMTGSIIRDRALKDADAPAEASAYYRALGTRGERVATFSPVRRGATLPEFNFDISYNWYPMTYVRPGPRVDIYRLNEAGCA